MGKDVGVTPEKNPSFTLGGLALVVNHERDDATTTATAIENWCGEHGVRVVREADGTTPLTVSQFDGIDLVVSLGGDGTVLRALHMMNGSSAAVLGVNFGTLGYLTSIEPNEVLGVLQALHDGSLPEHSGIEERMMLRVDVAKANGATHTLHALNEMVVEKVESGHTVRLEVSIDEQIFATYSADGVIVATPTGSTAYSLSARGPVVSPRHKAMILTPVSPHMLFDRALVLDPSEEISITVQGHRGVSLAVDGLQFLELSPGDVVRTKDAARVAKFLRVGSPRFHQILRQKFGLGAD